MGPWPCKVSDCMIATHNHGNILIHLVNTDIFLTLDAEATEVRVDVWDSGKSRSLCTIEEEEGIYGRNDQWNGREILINP